MPHFYFLSILCNAASGYILAFRKEEIREEGFSFSFDNGVFRLVLGVISVFTGLLKILSPMAGNIPVIGDLVPALANLAGGFVLAFEYYRNHTTLRSEAVEKLDSIIEKNKKAAGSFFIGAAVLHFVFYPILFL
ncbi:MAG: hypothetical protein LBH35_10455 [Treponema sp.]|nr:hypothetical protein [Treponema sp.]